MISILIVEDDLILAKRVHAQLNDLGYEEISSVMSGEEAIAIVKNHPPNIILMDIELSGNLSGIQTTEIINRINEDLPIVYLSKLDGQKITQPMKQTRHAYFLPKPFNLAQLKSILDYVLAEEENKSEVTIPILDGAVFLKKKDQYDKIPMDQILWVEGGRNTITVQTKNSGKYVVTGTFGPFIKRIDQDFLVRISKSYLINLHHVDTIRGNQFIINNQAIPFSKTYVPDLNKLLYLIKSSK